MSYERFLECDYLDAQMQPAQQMLHRCVQDPSLGFELSCTDTETYLSEAGLSHPRAIREKPNLMNTLSIQRGHEIGIEEASQTTLRKTQARTHVGTHEGFANAPKNVFFTDNGLGASRVPEGQCPDGYTRCSQTGSCIQVCLGCKYRKTMKSQEFNEADPCFPNGVYDGLDSQGNVKCTCGANNTYCPQTFVNNFSAEGSYVYGRGYRPDIGATDAINHLYPVI